MTVMVERPRQLSNPQRIRANVVLSVPPEARRKSMGLLIQHAKVHSPISKANFKPVFDLPSERVIVEL